MDCYGAARGCIWTCRALAPAYIYALWQSTCFERQLHWLVRQNASLTCRWNCSTLQKLPVEGPLGCHGNVNERASGECTFQSLDLRCLMLQHQLQSSDAAVNIARWLEIHCLSFWHLDVIWTPMLKKGMCFAGAGEGRPQVLCPHSAKHLMCSSFSHALRITKILFLHASSYVSAQPSR